MNRTTLRLVTCLRENWDLCGSCISISLCTVRRYNEQSECLKAFCRYVCPESCLHNSPAGLTARFVVVCLCFGFSTTRFLSWLATNLVPWLPPIWIGYLWLCLCVECMDRKFVPDLPVFQIYVQGNTATKIIHHAYYGDASARVATVGTNSVVSNLVYS